MDVATIARPSHMPKFKPPSTCTLWCPGQTDQQSAVLKDQSGYANDGAITTAVWEQLPSGLWVLTFDGDDKVDFGDHAVFDMGTGDFSLVTWVKMTSKTGYQVIFSNGTSGAPGRRYMLYGVDATGVIHIELDDTANPNTDGGAVDISDGVWRLISMSVDRSGNVVVYLNDSVEINVECTADGSLDATGSLYYGIDKDGSSSPFNGSLALPRVFKGAVLSATTTAGIYNQERHLFRV